MKMGQFNHNMQQYSKWFAAALNSWPYDHVSAATHSLTGRQQTGCSCVCFRAVTPPQAPSSSPFCVQYQLPLAQSEGAGQQRQLIIPLALKELTLSDFSAVHSAGTMSCWIQTGFPQVSKGTAGSVRLNIKTNKTSAWKQQIWSGAKLLLVLLATLAAAELFGKVYLDLKCNSKSSH